MSLRRRRRRFGRRHVRRVIRCVVVAAAIAVPAAPIEAAPHIVREPVAVICPYVPPCFGGPDLVDGPKGR